MMVRPHRQPLGLTRVTFVLVGVWAQHADGQSWPACYSGYFGCNAYALQVVNQYVLNGSGTYSCDSLATGLPDAMTSGPSTANTCTSGLLAINAYAQAHGYSGASISCSGGAVPRFLFVGSSSCDQVQSILQQAVPVAVPTAVPTVAPSATPTLTPTFPQTAPPTTMPTSTPTVLPTVMPSTASPTAAIGPALIATMGAYPGSSVVPPSGTVIVTAVSGGLIRVSANLQGLPPSSSGGIHIHTGTTCDTAANVGGHYWTPASNPDPWTTTMWTSNDAGAATAEFTVSTGYPLASNYGHAVVLHANDGSRIGCGVLVSTSTPPSAAPTIAPTVAPTVAPTSTIGPALIATMGSYPGSTAVPPSGTVIVTAVSGGLIRVSANLQGLPPSSSGGIHIHTGTTCDTAANVGGHYWTPASNPDPWTTVMWRSQASGAGRAEYVVSSGYPLASNFGHAVVVHASDGTRIGCGTLVSTTMPPTIAPSSSPTLAPTPTPTSAVSSTQSKGSNNKWVSILVPVLIAVIIVCGGVFCMRTQCKSDTYRDLDSGGQIAHNNAAYDSSDLYVHGVETPTGNEVDDDGVDQDGYLDVEA